MKSIEKISLIGIGAMGSFFAPRLFKTFKNQFRLIADGTRKSHLEETGVTINGVNYRFPIISPNETNDPADLIIIATKSYHFEQAMEDIANQVGEHTIILGIINGIQAEDLLVKRFKGEHVLYSLMRVSIVMKNKSTNFDPTNGAVYFGEKNKNTPGHYSERVLLVKEAFEKAKIPYRIPEDMQREIWHKFACNVSENLTCALLGISFGWFREHEHANTIRKRAFLEVVAVAKASKGILLTEEDYLRQQDVFFRIPPENKPSTLQDLEEKRHTEIDMFAKTMIDLGKQYHIPTPFCELFYHGIHVLEDKNSGYPNLSSASKRP